MNLTDEEHLIVMREFKEKTELYFKENIGMASELGINSNYEFDFDCYPAEDILTIAFKKAISIDTAEKILYIWNTMDISGVFVIHPIYAALEALMFDGMYSRMESIINERKSNEEKEKISDSVTVENSDQRKKRI